MMSCSNPPRILFTSSWLLGFARLSFSAAGHKIQVSAPYCSHSFGSSRPYTKRVLQRGRCHHIHYRLRLQMPVAKAFFLLRRQGRNTVACPILKILSPSARIRPSSSCGWLRISVLAGKTRFIQSSSQRWVNWKRSISKGDTLIYPTRGHFSTIS